MQRDGHHCVCLAKARAFFQPLCQHTGKEAAGGQVPVVFQALGDLPVAGLRAVEEKGDGPDVGRIPWDWLLALGRGTMVLDRSDAALDMPLDQKVELVGHRIAALEMEEGLGKVRAAPDAEVPFVFEQRPSANYALAGHKQVTDRLEYLTGIGTPSRQYMKNLSAHGCK